MKRKSWDWELPTTSVSMSVVELPGAVAVAQSNKFVRVTDTPLIRRRMAEIVARNEWAIEMCVAGAWKHWAEHHGRKQKALLVLVGASLVRGSTVAKF